MPDELTVFVPDPHSNSDLEKDLARGSGIVGSQVAETGRLRVDFEGDGEVYPDFAARVRRAAERHVWRGPDGKQGYPTRACAYVDRSELVAVGTYDLREKRVEVTEPNALRDWLDVEELQQIELLAE